MYLRTTARANKDGSVVRYLALAHNHRVGAATKAQVLLNLGREDRLDPDGLRRLVRSINRYLGEPDAETGTDAPAVTGTETGTETGSEGLRLVASRPAGAAWLLDGLWKALDVDTALRKVLGGRRFTTDVERVLFALVANRAIDPASKLAAAEWAGHDVAIPGLEAMDEDQAYRAMDLLIAADTDASVQEAVFFAVADLLNLEVDLLFFDTTSTYFERDTEDPDLPDTDTDTDTDGAAAETSGQGFRRYGHSKDHRKDLPQIVIGLAVAREGIPVRCWCWPGNTNDQAILPEVKDGLRGWRLGRVVTVVDRGFSSRENLAYLQRAGGHYIAGERMREGRARRRSAVPARPLPAGPRQPPRQGSQARLDTGSAMDHLPQPRGGRTRPGRPRGGDHADHHRTRPHHRRPRPSTGASPRPPRQHHHDDRGGAPPRRAERQT
jgi:hypothetical protein